MQLDLERTPDILGEVAAARSNGQLIIGFAAETEDLIKHATEKLKKKGLDAIVANDVSNSDSGFDSENNSVAIIFADDRDPVQLPLISKSQAAHRILDEIVKLRSNRRVAAGSTTK